MWFLVVALVSIVSSLLFGRLLARAGRERRMILGPRVHGPALESNIEANRLAASQRAQQKRVFETVHRN